MMCAVRVALMWSIIAASVVHLPLPVVPVTSTRPRSSAAIFFSTGGRPSSSMSGSHRDDAEDHADGAALLEDVAAEAAEPGHAVGQVDFVVVLELLAVSGGHHGRRHGDHVSWSSRLSSEGRRQRAADAHHREAADLEVQVGGAVVDGDFQEVVDMHVSLLDYRPLPPTNAAVATALTGPRLVRWGAIQGRNAYPTFRKKVRLIRTRSVPGSVCGIRVAGQKHGLGIDLVAEEQLCEYATDLRRDRLEIGCKVPFDVGVLQDGPDKGARGEVVIGLPCVILAT